MNENMEIRKFDLDEGDLSRVRANLVKQQALYEIAQALQLSDCYA